MTSPEVSIVIASQGRPKELDCALAALRYQTGCSLEAIVVSCERPRMAGAEKWVRHIPFNQRNLSRARNIGAAAARGQIVACLDDDAVPFPLWCCHIAKALDGGRVSWVTGPALKADGWQVEWKSCFCNSLGDDLELDHPEGNLKALGTNMAFRRDALAAVGGFDESFNFYLEDADISRILSLKAHAGDILDVPVIHGFASGIHRRRDRVPRSLFEIGASKAHFLVKHAPREKHQPALCNFAEAQRRRLLRFMVAGKLDPFEVPRLLRSLEAGFADGISRPACHDLAQWQDWQGAAKDERAAWENPARACRIDPRRFSCFAAARAEARELAQAGVPVLLGPVKARRPFVRFVLEDREKGVGFWEWSAGKHLPEAPPRWLSRTFFAEA